MLNLNLTSMNQRKSIVTNNNKCNRNIQIVWDEFTKLFIGFLLWSTSDHKGEAPYFFLLTPTSCREEKPRRRHTPPCGCWWVWNLPLVCPLSPKPIQWNSLDTEKGRWVCAAGSSLDWPSGWRSSSTVSTAMPSIWLTLIWCNLQRFPLSKYYRYYPKN